MNRERLLIGAALVLLGVGVAIWLLGESPSPPAGEPPASVVGPAAVERQVNAAEAPSEPARVEAAEPSETAAMRAELRRTLGSPSTAPGEGGVGGRASDPAGAGAAERAVPELDKDYIRERIREDLIPVAIECYEDALADDPKLGGKLVMSFAILGDPEVGGVVDEAAVVDEDSTLEHAALRECMRESLMAVSFDAPPDEGRVTVVYPFTFEPE